MGIPTLQRVECPSNFSDLQIAYAHAQNPLTLRQFKFVTEIQTAIGLSNGEHMGMDGCALAFYSQESESEADQLCTIKRTQPEATGFPRGNS